MRKTEQMLSSFKEWHYFLSGLAIGVVLGILFEKVI